jgi:hypothetical protein
VSILAANCINSSLVKSCRKLGIIIDENLKCVSRIDYIYIKNVKHVGIFYELRRKLTQVCLKNIYCAFIHSHNLYGIEMYSSASVSHLDKLVKLNNKILRILFYVYSRSHVGELYKKFGILPVSDLHELQYTTLVHKVFYYSYEVPTVFND